MDRQHTLYVDAAEDCDRARRERDATLAAHAKVVAERDRERTRAANSKGLMEIAGAEQEEAHQRAVAAEAALSRAREALAFAKSVIKSGEPWTDRCEQIFARVLASGGDTGGSGT